MTSARPRHLPDQRHSFFRTAPTDAFGGLPAAWNREEDLTAAPFESWAAGLCGR
ncbi:hypothetical protein OG780_40830 [Streptomyces sp. NBC_00386]|uniref:hypothetical protein n=1 Tax=Streptomyces sp. NBC_00386 TaxID=2975734 RepID=UPI002E1FE982